MVKSYIFNMGVAYTEGVCSILSYTYNEGNYLPAPFCWFLENKNPSKENLECGLVLTDFGQSIDVCVEMLMGWHWTNHILQHTCRPHYHYHHDHPKSKFSCQIQSMAWD